MVQVATVWKQQNHGSIPAGGFIVMMIVMMIVVMVVVATSVSVYPAKAGGRRCLQKPCARQTKCSMVKQPKREEPTPTTRKRVFSLLKQKKLAMDNGSGWLGEREWRGDEKKGLIVPIPPPPRNKPHTKVRPDHAFPCLYVQIQKHAPHYLHDTPCIWCVWWVDGVWETRSVPCKWQGSAVAYGGDRQRRFLIRSVGLRWNCVRWMALFGRDVMWTSW